MDTVTPACVYWEAREIYSSVSIEQCHDYNVVKQAVLKAYYYYYYYYYYYLLSLPRVARNQLTAVLNRGPALLQYIQS